MRKICIINQKGGVGKTTTTVTLAHGLAQTRRVLVIDFDPQGNSTECFGVSDEEGVYDFLIEDKDFRSCIQIVNRNLHVLPAKENLTKAELMLAGESSRETFLKRKLKNIEGYDYILLDCPPSLGLLNQNALLYADEALIPTSCDSLGLDAVQKMTDAIETINDVFGHKLSVCAIVPTLYDARLKTCREHLGLLQNTYYQLVTEPVRSNSKLRELPKSPKSIFEYAKSSNGAKDYRKVLTFVYHQDASDEERLANLVATTQEA